MKNLFSFCLLLLLLSSCKKEEIDYRNKFIGDFHFSVHYNYYSTIAGLITDSTYTYNGKVSFGNGKNDIIINYSLNQNILIEMYQDGTFKNNSHNSWEFESVDFMKAVTSNQWAGGSYYYLITGQRIK